MGLARELSMGPRKRRPRIGNSGDFAVLRNLTEDPSPDLERFRQVLDRVRAQPTRFRYAEGAVFTAACARYSALTGESYGIQPGTY